MYVFSRNNNKRFIGLIIVEGSFIVVARAYAFVVGYCCRYIVYTNVILCLFIHFFFFFLGLRRISVKSYKQKWQNSFGKHK